MADPATTALMHTNLYEVFGQRDPTFRREAIARTFTEDVAFTDESGTIIGGTAIDNRAYSSCSKTPPRVSRSPPMGPSTLAKTPRRWPGAWDPQTVSQSHAVVDLQPRTRNTEAGNGGCGRRASQGLRWSPFVLP